MRRSRLLAALPEGMSLPEEDWLRHHRLVLRVLWVLSVAVPAYGLARGLPPAHAVGHAVPLVALTLLAAPRGAGRGWRSVAAATALMTASALVVHASHGATEAHFMFFALLPLVAVYAAWTPFLVAIGYVAVHHLAVGLALPQSVFDRGGPALGLALLHAAFVVVESLACMAAWRLSEDRRASVERLVRDRTAELREQRDEMARLATVVESTDDAVVTTTTGAVIVTWNAGAERLFGYAPEEALGRPITMLLPPEQHGFVRATFAQLAESPSFRVESVHVRKDASTLDASVTISAIRGAHGAVSGAVAIARDVSERKRSEAEAHAAAAKLQEQAEALTHLALHDALTGLANRALLQDRLEHCLARRGPSRLAVLLLDVDDFKTVNDVSGHTVGDRLLVEVAARLQSSVRPADVVARLGGDEFVLLLEDVEDRRDAVRVADRILSSLVGPIVIDDERFVIDASIGITVSDGVESRSPTELLRDADIAMYAAKRGGKGRYAVFEAHMHDEVRAHTGLVRDLRDAVAQGQLRLLYQPQIAVASGRMTGVEALVRWEHPERGLLTPDRFIPAAEATRMIAPIDDWVLDEACAQLRRWDDEGLRPVTMAINVSACRLVTGDLAATIAAVTGRHRVDPARLEIEITETVAIDHDGPALAAITGVRALGVRVAIDDFGMGHSALSRLQTFPIDRLKIDRSFIGALSVGAERGSIVDAMIAMGQSLGLDVVAEGVETAEHVRALRTLGCPTAQGYLFSRPVAAELVTELVRRDEPLAPPTPAGPAEPDDAQALDRRERMVHNLLAELQRITGLESTYLTRIDWDRALQHVSHARNAGAIEIPEGLEVAWADTVCRRALEQGVTYTDQAQTVFADSEAAAQLGLQTYLSVPLRGSDGVVAGTLCGASSRRVALGPEAIEVMERFARMITGGVGSAGAPAGPRPDATPPDTVVRNST